MGSYRPCLSLFGYLATGDQHRHNDRHVPVVFLIQNTQNRDARAINLKLDELIRAMYSARNQMINIENLSDMELDLLQAQYEKLTASRERSSVANKPTYASPASPANDQPCKRLRRQALS